MSAVAPYQAKTHFARNSNIAIYLRIFSEIVRFTYPTSIAVLVGLVRNYIKCQLVKVLMYCWVDFGNIASTPQTETCIISVSTTLTNRTAHKNGCYSKISL